MRANQTLSTFLLTNTSLSAETVDHLMKARLNLQVKLYFILAKCQCQVFVTAAGLSTNEIILFSLLWMELRCRTWCVMQAC